MSAVTVSYDLSAAEHDAAIRAKLIEMGWQPPNTPIDMVLHCPACGLQHIDAPENEGKTLLETDWENPPHRSHLCHGCGHIWRPADVPTNGVAAVKTKGKADSPIRPPLGIHEFEVRLGKGMHIDHSNHFRNGTAVITVKRVPRGAP